MKAINLGLVRMTILLLLYAWMLAAQMPHPAPESGACDVQTPLPAGSSVPSPSSAVILASANDPYYTLAQEIAQHETLPIVHSFQEARARNPVFLLWVVSPSGLSDQGLVAFSLALKEASAISVGIISGDTLESARDLWWRATQVKGQRVIAVNGEYPAAWIAQGRIMVKSKGESAVLPLTSASLQQALQNADYVTFTGHGGRRYWRLDENTAFSSADVPRLGPVVIGTASCNTFRIWEKDSIALAFARQGAAAYAGFAYSPNEGYLIGEFDGLPFRYTWPDFPIGHVVQAQNRGALQGFARFPYYYLLGDPRIALQTQPSYRLLADSQTGEMRTLSYADAPVGVVPVRIPGGARYRFVEIPGVAAAWDDAPFYNAHLQTVNIRNDKYLLFVHRGGDFTLHLRPNPPWYWVAADLLTDSLDHALVYVQQTGGDILSLFAACIASMGVAWILVKRQAPLRSLVFAVLTGLGLAVLQGIYVLARLGQIDITSKPVKFSFLSLVGAGLLAGCGAFLYLNARSRLAREIAISVAVLPTLAATGFSLGCVAAVNGFLFAPELGTGLYNYALGSLSLGALIFQIILFELVCSSLVAPSYRRWLARLGKDEPLRKGEQSAMNLDDKE